MPSLSSVPKRLGNLGSGGVVSTPGKGSRTVVLEGGSVSVRVYVCWYVCADTLSCALCSYCSPGHVSILAGRKGDGL